VWSCCSLAFLERESVLPGTVALGRRAEVCTRLACSFPQVNLCTCVCNCTSRVSNSCTRTHVCTGPTQGVRAGGFAKPNSALSGGQLRGLGPERLRNPIPPPAAAFAAQWFDFSTNIVCACEHSCLSWRHARCLAGRRLLAESIRVDTSVKSSSAAAANIIGILPQL
jgi:hypothetical protein